MSTVIVTGGAGFIGSHLVDSLLADSSVREVRVLDNFSSGRRLYLDHHRNSSRLKVFEVELLELEKIKPLFPRADCVFHLAANPDARWGIDNTRLDLEQETIVTYNVLESMRLGSVSSIVFSSSGTVYGDYGKATTIETLGPCLPISLYGAGKLASEGLISGFSGTFGLKGWIYRFGNVIGERTTHGVVFDFIRKLRDDSSELQVLGDGNQSKPYLYVKDLVQGLRFAQNELKAWASGRCDVFNIAPDDASSVASIAEALLSVMKLEPRPRLKFQNSDRGWAGDVPHSRMTAEKLKTLGFVLPRGSDEAVRVAVEAIWKHRETYPV